jgi:transcription antitermination factor NusG
MPLLPLETFLSPEDLLDRPADALPREGRCWVLHTRPRAEKALAEKFVGRKLSFYLPLHRRQWRARGRVLSSYLPLFPGYVFLHGDAEARLQALQTNAVVRSLPVPDQARLHADLARIHRLIRSEAALTPEARLRPGTPVEVVGGPFLGMQGKVFRQGKKRRFFVEVQFLQQGVSVEVDARMIQPLGQAVTGRGR